MKLQTFILFISFIFFGFIVPLWGASSQGSSTASPSPTAISTLDPSKIDPLVRVQQRVENDPRSTCQFTPVPAEDEGEEITIAGAERENAANDPVVQDLARRLGVPVHFLLDFRERAIGRFGPRLDRIEGEAES